MLGGITAYDLRLLCESGWNGGAGYTPNQIGQMTLDQIWFRLCNKELLKREVGKREEKMETLVAAGSLKADEDGLIKGRAEDGTPIKGRIKGKSVARQLMEEEAKKKQAMTTGQKRRERRRQRREDKQ